MKVALNTTKQKEAIKASIVQEKEINLDGTFTYDGNEYYCDPTFQEAVKAYLIAYATGMVSPTQQVVIRRPDRSFWYPNQVELLPFAGALMAHVAVIWDNYWKAKDLI
jgi:hypothetical protein